ncbi:extracellular solute-binding protein [Actinoplanes sp. NPDC049316]|uniref:extracellular solute-binding protein n=1 Tax=Actinoplanes sp. NPDC049316 TaxID=3154727 RepID=UPI0034152B9C
MTLTRRALLSGAAAGAALGLSGCSGLTPGRRSGGSLDYWNLFGGGDGVRMTQMLDAFRAANPGTDLSAVTLAWGNPYYTKLSLATLGEKPPDVAVAHLTRMKTMVQAGLVEELHPDDLARHGLTAGKFAPRPWQAGLVDGRTYAIPLDTHPFVMFYNTDVCEKAGLLDSSGALSPLDSPEKFTDALRRAKEVTKAYGGVVAVTNETATPWRIYQSLYSQLGGEMLAGQGRKVVIDDDRAGRVLGFLQGLTRSGVAPSSIDYQGAIATFANGQAGFYFQGEWEISTFQTAKTPFSMTLFPDVFGGGQYAVQADSHTLIIPRQPGRDPERVDRALLFIRSMLDQSKTWAEGGHVPAWLPFRDSAEYKAMTPQSNYATAADAAVYDPEGWYSGSGSNFEIVTGSIIASVMAGQQAPASAIAQMRDKLTNLAETAPPV